MSAARAVARPGGLRARSERGSDKPAQRALAGLYVEFVRAASALGIPPSLAALDPLEERMLAWLAAEIFSGHELSVRQVMSHDEFGAPATIHSRLKAMRIKGWIVLADTEDGRRKRIALTRATFRHFDRLGRTMAKAVQTQPR